MRSPNVILDPYMGQVVAAMCGAVGTDVAMAVAKAYGRGDIEGLNSLRVDPAQYSDARRYREDNACVELLRKCCFPGASAKIRRRKALDNFYASEHQCFKTNRRLEPLLNNFFGEDAYLVEFLDKARLWISETLGRIPTSVGPRFGPGSTYDDRGWYITVPDKMTARPTIYEESRDLIPLLEGSAWWRSLLADHSRHSDPKTIRGNRFTTVPKESLKDRGICIEAGCNIALQLPIGAMLKRKLYCRNIDLVNGQDRHRRWVQRASLSGEHATIDLSNASDTLAISLVKLLLPPNWYDLLSCLRAPLTRLPDGKWVRLEKFSSMGNGFTFELESLIFAAICFAAGCGCPGVDFSVYGDDIIVPTEKARTVLAALSFFGFTANSRKTFVSGPFRESCGGDFFEGVPVRAHYVKEVPTSPAEWISLANGLRRLSKQDSSVSFECSPYFQAWKVALGFIPKQIRQLRGPEQFGDLVIHDDIFPFHQRADFPGQRFIRIWKPVATSLDWKHWKPGVVMAAALYGLPQEGVIPRDAVSGYKVDYLPFS